MIFLVFSYDFSYSLNCVETAIHKLKTSPLFDAFNTAHTTIANTPPTYEEIIRQATAELENEQARDILKIKKMKTAKQHQFSSLHQPIKSSRQGVIKGSYQRKAAPEHLSQQLQKLCRGYLERRKVKKMKHMTVHLNKVATLSLIIQRYSRSKLAQKHVRRIHSAVDKALEGLLENERELLGTLSAKDREVLADLLSKLVTEFDEN